jgi:hypothetical protein
MRSFCVKEGRIIQYEKPESGIARPYLYFVGSSLWETDYFCFSRVARKSDMSAFADVIFSLRESDMPPSGVICFASETFKGEKSLC